MIEKLPCTSSPRDILHLRQQRRTFDNMIVLIGRVVSSNLKVGGDL